MGRSGWVDEAEHRIVAGLAVGACTPNAEAMRSYMRDQFPFHGLKMAQVVAVWKDVRREVAAELGEPTADDLVALAEAMWELPEREHQYVGAKALMLASRRRDLGGLEARHLAPVRDLIVAKAWWDTVDILAPNVVGALARAYPDDVVPELDRWIEDRDHWLVRSALLHQLRWKAATDPDRLARYCLAVSGNPEFFVRKAIGWALRAYSYVEPEWVEAFVTDHVAVLSRLSRREAMKVIERQRA